MAKMRTIEAAAKELKEMDPETALTECALRRMIKSGKIPHTICGRKRLINMDILEKFLNGEPIPKMYGSNG